MTAQNASLFDIAAPRDMRLPVLFDSPHSGFQVPDEWRPAASLSDLRTSWDAFVDELFGAAPDHGATLLRAHFPRSFIDLNRRRDDIDPGLLSGEATIPMRPGRKSEKGFGLLRRFALPGVPVYDRLLPAAEVERWIATYYDPYHAALRRHLDALHAEFGFVWHLNCHSMKSVGNAMNDDGGMARPDLVVSDRDGTTSDPAFTRWIADLFRKKGYGVGINDPYKGAELVAAYGDPARGRFSVQIEVNRALYMDEGAFEKSAGFAGLRAGIGEVIALIAAEAKNTIEKRRT